MITDVSCVKCSSTQDKNCVSLGNNIQATKCAPFVNGYVNYCFTHLTNETVNRGCILEHEPLIDECNSWYSNTCEECLGSNCNNVPVDGEYCIECDAKTDENCTTNIGEYMRKECPLSFKKLGCYRRSESGNGKWRIFVRGIIIGHCLGNIRVQFWYK